MQCTTVKCSVKQYTAKQCSSLQTNIVHVSDVLYRSEQGNAFQCSTVKGDPVQISA